MYHDQSFGIKSEELVTGTSMEDLNLPSLETYRNHLRYYNSGFPYNNLNDEAFCRKIGICSNSTGELPYGSLLMFGKQDSIRAAIPNFWVDYIEIPGVSVATAVPRYTFRMQEQENIWEYYNVIIQRLRLYADNLYTTTPLGVSPEDDSQLYALREGLINFLAHSDWFSPMHPTIRVFDNRIEFQNPGGFIVPVDKVLQEAISLPRNPIIIKLFRFAKLSENAGYGIDKMKTWTTLTGKNVGFKSDVTHATVTYFKSSDGVDHVNEQVNEQVNEHVKFDVSNIEYVDYLPQIETKILRLIIKNENIIYAEIHKKTAVSVTTIRRILKKLRDNGILIREGSDKTGRWVVTEKGKILLQKKNKR